MFFKQSPMFVLTKFSVVQVTKDEVFARGGRRRLFPASGERLTTVNRSEKTVRASLFLSLNSEDWNLLL
jgi:hypothetical protein